MMAAKSLKNRKLESINKLKKVVDSKMIVVEFYFPGFYRLQTSYFIIRQRHFN